MNQQLQGMRIIVIGGGPAGLTFAKAVSSKGAKVRVLEQAGDPRGPNAGYTDRSFNLTLNSVGRTVLADKRVWRGGTEVRGRAIHDISTNDARFATFGDDDAAMLMSVPRPVLRQNMVNLVLEHGVDFSFDCKVISINSDEGQIEVKKGLENTEVINADLVVVADGLHSIADKIITDNLKGSLNIRKEPLNYITVKLDNKACVGQSMHHIHFWHQPEGNSVAIGLPNADGSIAALLISRYEDVSEAASPFQTTEQALSRLTRDFPQLLKMEPNLVSQVIGKKRGHFYYKSITNYILGKKCVVIGDASSACPPWAGFGANTAIYSADALMRFMVGLYPNIDQALISFEHHKKILAELVLNYANQHGEFLSQKVAQNPEQRPIGPVLGQLVKEAINKSNIPEGVSLLAV